MSILIKDMNFPSEPIDIVLNPNGLVEVIDWISNTLLEEYQAESINNNVEILRKVAKEMGYRIIKDNPMPKLIPCKCGCNKRTLWYDMLYDTLTYKCKKCGYSVTGKNERHLREKWNKEMSE